MKLINRILLLIIISLSIIANTEAQETMYIIKDGVVVGEHVLAEVDSVIFYQPSQGILIDNDGNEYQTVLIGTQTWMSENLRTTTYNDGTAIHKITDNALWADISIGAYCWYDNDETFANDNNYGALYNWYTIETNKLCPSGWHVPSDEEWQILERFLGISESDLNATGYRGTTEGLKLKANSGWYSTGNGTNDYDFSAPPSGGRHYSNSGFYDASFLGTWWSGTENGNDAYSRLLYCLNDAIMRNLDNKNNGFSVRCIKD
ncbi:fibrobacter succinogenes major paralogous domain-containing protein [Carboxylicivirga sp. RSCT41]|uniref:fibrobacter succinogenes major paralogous domain-containing protein n=1 Tax=Carboxylicivirga agarovorans TaxID=3417570 RepID=UPI003D32E2C3